MTPISDSKSSVIIHQYLFGYSQGHRLLKGSGQLSHDIQRELLKLTDSPGGSPISNDASLLRGVPLKSDSKYALMRTWPATHRGARPGTVWTHVLLINFVSFAKDGLVKQLNSHFKKPIFEDNFDNYEESIVIKLQSKSLDYSIDSNRNSSNAIKWIIGNTYANSIDTLEGNNKDTPQKKVVSLVNFNFTWQDLENAIFQIWDQQWPRLKRSFSFSVGEWQYAQHSNNGFQDVNLVIFPNTPKSKLSLYSNQLNYLDEDNIWIDLLLQDIHKPGLLRAFLRRAGSDIDNPMQAMRPLIKIYMILEYQERWESEQYNTVLDLFLEASGNYNSSWLFSYLINIYVWESLPEFKIKSFFSTIFSRQGMLDNNTEYWNDVVDHLLKDRENDVLDIFEIALNYSTKQAENFIDIFLESAPTSYLQSLIKINSHLMVNVIKRRPSILEETSFWINFSDKSQYIIWALIDLKYSQINSLDWNAVMTNLVKKSGSISIPLNLIKSLPEEAFISLIEIISHTRATTLTSRWKTPLRYRINDVIEWLANHQHPSPLFLMWLIEEMDNHTVDNSQLKHIWINAGLSIKKYPSKSQGSIATEVMCSYLMNGEFNADLYRNIIDPSWIHLRDGKETARQHQIFQSYLPILSKKWDNWDICKRLEIRMAQIFVSNDILEIDLEDFIENENLSSRIARYMRKEIKNSRR